MFRQEKHKMRKEKKLDGKITNKYIQKKQNNNGQKSINSFCTKKATSGIQQKDKEMNITTTVDEDEDF